MKLIQGFRTSTAFGFRFQRETATYANVHASHACLASCACVCVSFQNSNPEMLE